MDRWGPAGQERLKRAKVFLAGAGGLGSPAAIYLAVAGAGHLLLCDFDAPELTNLNRQILHNTSRIGMNKARSGKVALNEHNPDVRVTAVEDRITADNVDELVGNSDIILDCMDNFPTRFILNACAARKQIPLVHGSVWGMEGRMMFVHSPQTPCLQCLFPEAPPSQVFPVVGATPGVIGSMQALEAIKYLVGVGVNSKGRLLMWDGARAEFKVFRIRRDPECPVCGSLEMRTERDTDRDLVHV